ncbi:MAG: Kelch repeat-containing protein [Actinomycetota bacterium]
MDHGSAGLGEPRRHRLVAALVAVVVFSAAGVFTLRAFEPVRDAARAHVRAATGPGDPWAGYAEGWTELPPPPKVPQGAAFVWTGSALLLWGGYDGSNSSMTSAGYSFDPSTNAWQTLPQAPVAVANARPVWTGHEAIFWGGNDSERNRLDGVAYDPVSETWRMLPPAPLDPAWGGVTVWTGSELIVWGGGDPGNATNTSGAAYDPSTDVWHLIADAPIGLNLASGVWSGTEMIVFGSLLDHRNVAATDHALGEAYDPKTDAWRVLAPSELSPQASSSVWLDGGMFSWDYETHGAWYDPGTDTWGDVQKLPIEPSECYPDSVTVGPMIFAWFCGEVATYDTTTQDWRDVTGGMTTSTIEANGQSYILYRFASLAAAGDVVALAGEGITVTDAGEPCYGCPGSPSAFWIYRPPSQTPTITGLEPPSFEPADGWATISTSTDPIVADPKSCCATWAANVPFAAEDLSKDSVDGVLRWWTFPGLTIRELPPEGIVIVAEVDPTLPSRCCGHFDAAAALRLSDADVQRSWEGQIAPNVPLYLLDAYVGGRDLDVRIFFGSLDPSEATLSAAQDELDRLVIPPAPAGPFPSN